MNKRDVIATTVEKLKNYEQMKQVMMDPANSRTALGNVIPWDTTSLCAGLPGISLAFSQLIGTDTGVEGLEETAKSHLGRAVELFNQNGSSDCSLHSGLAGLGLGITSLAKKTGGYEQVLGTIHQAIAAHADDLIAAVDAKAIIGYDIISGLSGIAGYLLLHTEDDTVYHTLEAFVDALIRFSLGDEGRYGWLVPPHFLFSDLEREQFPRGAFNSGYAHGIAGVLGLLAKACKRGIVRPGQMDAIKRIMEYYDRFKIFEDDRYIWKGQMGIEELEAIDAGAENPVDGDFFRRDAWCYGAPGICYGLLQATDVVADGKTRQMAMETMKKALQHRDAIYSPTYCHGYAGLLQIAKASQRLVEHNFLQEECDTLEQMILDSYDATLHFGFCDHEFSSDQKEFVDYHEPGLLCGSTGIVLALQDDGKKRAVYQSAFGL
ncbi:MAG: lanthionine synthetase C family protein [Lachnospiraceae bacterium]|nr:lanthionine synthetase C family protein [Lachnospiraceae bacterium]